MKIKFLILAVAFASPTNFGNIRAVTKELQNAIPESATNVQKKLSSEAIQMIPSASQSVVSEGGRKAVRFSVQESALDNKIIHSAVESSLQLGNAGKSNLVGPQFGHEKSAFSPRRFTDTPQRGTDVPLSPPTRSLSPVAAEEDFLSSSVEKFLPNSPSDRGVDVAPKFPPNSFSGLPLTSHRRIPIHHDSIDATMHESMFAPIRTDSRVLDLPPTAFSALPLKSHKRILTPLDSIGETLNEPIFTPSSPVARVVGKSIEDLPSNLLKDLPPKSQKLVSIPLEAIDESLNQPRFMAISPNDRGLDVAPIIPRSSTRASNFKSRVSTPLESIDETMPPIGHSQGMIAPSFDHGRPIRSDFGEAFDKKVPKVIRKEKEYPSWAVTSRMQKLFDESRRKGLDVSSPQVIENIRSKAIADAIKSNNINARSRPGSIN